MLISFVTESTPQIDFFFSFFMDIRCGKFLISKYYINDFFLHERKQYIEDYYIYIRTKYYFVALISVLIFVFGTIYCLYSAQLSSFKLKSLDKRK